MVDKEWMKERNEEQWMNGVLFHFVRIKKENLKAFAHNITIIIITTNTRLQASKNKEKEKKTYWQSSKVKPSGTNKGLKVMCIVCLFVVFVVIARGITHKSVNKKDRKTKFYAKLCVVLVVIMLSWCDDGGDV